MTTSPRMNPTSNHIYVKYHWFGHNIGRGFLIQNIKSENQKADIFTKGLKGGFLSVLGHFFKVGKPSD